jgi:hypothetical protein
MPRARPHDGVVAGPVLDGQLVQPRQRRVGRGQAGAQLLPLLDAVAPHAEAVDQRGQRQPLDDQGDEDHREGQEQDQVPLWEALQGQRQRGRQRDRPAHPAPPDHQPLPRADPPGDLRGSPVEQPDQVGDGEPPGDARGDHHRADQRPQADQLRGRAPADLAQDGVEL